MASEKTPEQMFHRGVLTTADHLDLVLSPEYNEELEPGSLQVRAEMKIEAVSSLQGKKITGDGWLGMCCPCSWFSRIIRPYISTLSLLPS